jgi:hypothetical protein
MITTAKWTVILFGIYFICAGIIMLIAPTKARELVRTAGSTNFINYLEIALRMLPAIGLILCAEISKYPTIFNLAGRFILFTSLILFFVPRHLHHKLSIKFAKILKPFYFQLISPFAFGIGIWIIYSVI